MNPLPVRNFPPLTVSGPALVEATADCQPAAN